MKILAADIGGTKTLMMIAACDAGRCTPLIERTFTSAAHTDFNTVVKEFLRQAGKHAHGLDSACIAVAGPVHGDHARVTKLPWVLDVNVLQPLTGAGRVRLINDFQAVGWGLTEVPREELHTLQEGKRQKHAPMAVIGAGTGLGQAIAVWQKDHYDILATEGGHVEFGPTDAEQDALLRYTRQRFGHVSYDRLASGPGLAIIYEFLTTDQGLQPTAELAAAVAEGDTGAALGRFCISGSDPLAEHAIDLFLRIYGAQAGNLALSCLPRGGLFIAGGIAARILPRLRAGGFMQAFHDKGRMSGLLAEIPVQVVLSPRVGLLGAARAAQFA
jgi:glucokinase